MVVGVATGMLPALAAGQAPTKQALEEQAKRCRELLIKSVVDFYLPDCVDHEHGGYLEELDSTGHFTGTRGKFLVLQGRHLWLFSTLAAEGIRREESLAAARSGFEFLQAKFHDPVQGGYYSRVAANGDPQDKRKHVYLNSFALYGLVAYFRATQDPAALAAARELFEQLEVHAHDERFGGYVEFFDEDWRPVLDTNERGYVGAIGTKTYNSHLHLLESVAALYEIWPDPRVANRLAELIQINTHTVRHPELPCNIDGWSRDWKMIDSARNLRASYGHDVECAWLVLDAARRLKWSPELLRNWAVALCDYSLEHGFDEMHGGFFYTGPLGSAADARHKEWWVQSEALVSMLEMYRLTGDERYFRAFTETLEFIVEHQVAEKGGWWATRAEDGGPHRNESRTSMWQGGYHNGRALLLSAWLLDAMAEEAK
jgi:mannobiose 2-epimerase